MLFGNFQTRQSQGNLLGLDATLSQASQAVKHAASHDLLSFLVTKYSWKDNRSMEKQHSESQALQFQVNGISVDHIRMGCHLLLSLGDFYGLGQLLCHAIPKASREVTLVILDAVNQNFSILRSLDCLPRLLMSIFRETVQDKSSLLLDVSLSGSLRHLRARVPREVAESKDLDACIELVLKVAAQSADPISNQVPDLTGRADCVLLDDIEKKIAVGSPIDKPTFTRAFKILTGNLDFEQCPTTHDTRFVNLLRAIQVLHSTKYNELSNIWMRRELADASGGKVLGIVLFVVCQGICSLRLIVECTFLDEHPDRSHKLGGQPAQKVLNVLSVDKVEMRGDLHCRPYRFWDQRRQLIVTNPGLILMLMKTALLPDQLSDNGIYRSGHDLDKAQRHLSLLYEVCRSLPIQDCESLDKLVMHDWIGQYIVQLEATQNHQRTIPQQIAIILARVTGPSVAVCCFKLRYLLYKGSLDEGHSLHTLARLLIDKIDQISVERISLWTSLISSISIEHAGIICSAIEAVLLSGLLDDPPILTVPSTYRASGLCKIYKAAAGHFRTHMPEQTMEKLTFAAINLLALTERKQKFQSNSSIAFAGLGILLHLLAAHGQSLGNVTGAQRSSLVTCLVKVYLRSSTMWASSSKAQLVKVLSLLVGPSSEEHLARFAFANLSGSYSMTPIVKFALAISQDSQTYWLFRSGRSQLANSGCLTWQADLTRAANSPFQIRSWEMISDAAPHIGENDTALNIGFFGTHKSSL